MKKVIVVGAGVAGLATAIRLQKDGYSVTIVEKESKAGGKMNLIEENGFRFDVGPTIVMMPHIYKEVFEYAGVNPDDYIPMERLDPIYNLTFANGEQMSVSTELTDLIKDLESYSEQDTAGYLSYLASIYKRYLIAKDHFIEKSFRSPLDFFNPKTLWKALQLRTFDNAYDSIGKFVKDDRLRKVLSFQTLYIGISPFNGPSIYTIIPMIELLYGVWYIKGGMYTMANSMVRLFEELGGTIQYNTTVEELIIENKKATGIVTSSGTLKSDYVICNADFPYAVKHLIKEPKNKGKYTDKKIDNMEYSCSCFLLYIGTKKKYPDLQVHNLYFAEDFDKNINDIFEGRLPQDPSFYIYSPSQIDETVAPEGKEGLYVLVPVPECSYDHLTWDDQMLKTYRDKIISLMEKIPGLEDLQDNIIFETYMTPKNFEKQFNAYRGATFGLRPSLLQSNYFRPQIKFPYVDNLYFTGSSTHPGAGVPIVLTSAKLAAQELKRDDLS